MNSMKSLLSFFTLIVVFSFSSHAQVFWGNVQATNVQTCLQPEFAEVNLTLLAIQPANTQLRINAPVGTIITSVDSVLRNGSSFPFTVSYSAGNRIATIVFTNGIALADNIRIRFKHFATCAAGISSYTIRDTISYLNSSGGLVSTQLGNLFNGSSPALSITSVNNTPGTAGVGQLVVRRYTITNGGNGSTSRFFVSDNFGAGNLVVNTGTFRINPSGVNFPIPLANITLVADSVLINFTPALIQQIGDLDTLFENSENFVLQYEVTPQNCGIGNVVLSRYRTSWLCPGNARCNYYSVSDGLSITIPGAPNLVYFQSLTRKRDCWNNNLHIDTGSIRNIGTGPARDIIINVGINGYPVIFRGDMAGYFDTANFFVRRGRNGAWQKVAYTVTLVGNTALTGIGCNLTGRPMAVRFTWPNLNAGDTLYFTAPIQYCNWNYPCEASQNYLHQIGIPGTLMQIDGFKNGCGNISFVGFKNSILGYIYPALQAQNLAPQAADRNTRANFQQNLQNIPTNFFLNAKAVTDIKINLPSVLQFDTAAGPLVYILSGTTVILPTSHPSPTVWRFKNAILPTSGTLNIRLKGFCDPAVCSGIVNWGYEWSTNPDTTFCSNFNRWGCLSFPISWTSDCRVCCDSGLVNLVYTTNRVNFGQPDNNNDFLPDGSGTINLANVRTNNFLFGDTVEYFQKSYVLQGTTPWSSLVGEFNVPNGTAWWDLLSNEVTIIRAGGGTNTASATANWSGSTLRLNYSSLAPFNNNDTVYFRVRLRLKANTETGFITQNAAYVSHINNINQSSATRFSCGPIIDGMTLWNHTQFLDRVQELTSNGCGQIIEGNYFYTAEGSYGYGGINRFPFEYRPNAYPTQVKHKYPSGWQVDSVALIFNAGSNFPAAYSNLNVPFTYINDTLKYDLSPYFTPNGGLLFPADEGGTLGVYHYLKPTCRAVPSTTFTVPAQNDWSAFVINVRNYALNSTSLNTQTSIRNVQPQFLVNSATPVSTAFTKNVSWPLTYTNVTSINSVNNWIYLRNTSGQVTIDSVKEGSTIIPQDVNGFYRLGAINANASRNLRIFASSTACSLDSVILDWGYGCAGYPTSLANLCNYPPVKLFVQPAPAAIQTTITSLQSTPINPANPSAGNYGNDKVFMCSTFPMEFNILSTEPGTIYTVRERVFLPISGLNVGLDYVPDSGYIEFPVGTSPRPFSAAANAALLAQVSSGVLTFDLAQIDPINFNATNGLFGTGSAPSNNHRRAILRFKFRTNCNLISGAQWQAQQQAISPCGGNAGGNNGVTSGFPLNINGVVPVPYISTVSVVPTLSDCDGDTCTFKIVKIGNSAVDIGDSIRIFIPQELSVSGFRCAGSACPTANPVLRSNPALGGTEYALRIPTTTGNLDSIILKTRIKTPQPNGCSNSVRVSCDITRQLRIFCPTIAADCPNSKQSLGSSTQFISIDKPNLSLTSFTGAYSTGIPQFVYNFGGTIQNSSTVTSVTAGDTTSVSLYWDVDNNNTLNTSIDRLVHVHYIRDAIANNNGTVTFNDTFRYTGGLPPNPTRGMFAVIEANGSKPNCNCSPMAQSSMITGLPVNWLEFTARLEGNTAQLSWKTTGEKNESHYIIQRRFASQSEFRNLGQLKALLGNSVNFYSYADDLQEINEKIVYYRIIQVEKSGKETISPLRILVVDKKLNFNNGFALWPNPTNQYLQISSTDNLPFRYQINDVSGKTLFQETVKETSAVIDMSGQMGGVYTITLWNENIKSTQKFIYIRK